MIESWKIPHFDNVEFNGAENLTHSFPDHFHYEYSIGMAVGGIQQFHLRHDSYLIAPQTIIIINPEQIHAHYPANDLGWSYKSMYISPDFMKHLRPKAGNLLFDHPVITNPFIYQAYQRLHSRKTAPTEKAYAELFASMFRDIAANHEVVNDNFLPEKIAGIRQYLTDNYAEKLQLDKLAATFFIDKFQLIRQFKKHTGVTPNAYLTIVRIEKSKQFINQQYPIVEAALEAGFYDQSHFHHSFLHYTSLTPRQYQKRNILQD
jgi:AraC-like DNA-binding protein